MLESMWYKVDKECIAKLVEYYRIHQSWQFTEVWKREKPDIIVNDLEISVKSKLMYRVVDSYK